MNKLLYIPGVVSCLIYVQLASGNQEIPESFRLATVKEVQQLFDLATTRPSRSRFVADIELIAPIPTSDKVAALLQMENDALKASDSHLTSARKEEMIAARSEGIARALGGRRVQHVSEWYSGHYSRLDETDGELTSSNYTATNEGLFQQSFVNIHDAAFSPYSSFSVNHELHSALLSKDPSKYFRVPNDLWRVLGMDKELGEGLIFALADFNSLDMHTVQSINRLDADSLLNTLKASSWAIQTLHNGSNTNWRLQCSNGSVDGMVATCFRFEGKYPTSDAPWNVSSNVLTYWVGKVAGRTVLFQGSLTNITLHTSYASKREKFDGNGFPHVLKMTRRLQNGTVEESNVTFKEIDAAPSFIDETVFSPQFATNYFITDVTVPGPGIILQNPDSRIPVVQPLLALHVNKRAWILTLLAVVAIAPLPIIYIMRRHESRVIDR